MKLSQSVKTLAGWMRTWRREGKLMDVQVKR